MFSGRAKVSLGAGSLDKRNSIAGAVPTASGMGENACSQAGGDDTAARRPGPPPTDTAQAEVALGTLQSVGLPTGGRHTQDRRLAEKVFPLMFVISDPVCWTTGIDWLASPESKAKKCFSINLHVLGSLAALSPGFRKDPFPGMIL